MGRDIRVAQGARGMCPRVARFANRTCRQHVRSRLAGQAHHRHGRRHRIRGSTRGRRGAPGGNWLRIPGRPRCDRTIRVQITRRFARPPPVHVRPGQRGAASASGVPRLSARVITKSRSLRPTEAISSPTASVRPGGLHRRQDAMDQAGSGIGVRRSPGILPLITNIRPRAEFDVARRFRLQRLS